MADREVNRPIARVPTHPGELMREILDDHVRLPVAEAAKRMKVSPPALDAVLNGAQPVTAEMALRFGRLTGGRRSCTFRCRRNLSYGRRGNG